MPDKILPADLPECIIQSIQIVASSAAYQLAQTLVDPEKIDPLKAGHEVVDITESIIRHGNYEFLPTYFDDDYLSVISSGKVVPQHHYPQQLGLLVARTGFASAANNWGKMAQSDIEKSAIQTSAAAAAFYYTLLAAFDTKQAIQAGDFVREKVSQAFNNLDPNTYLSELSENVCYGRLQKISLPQVPKNKDRKVFASVLAAALEAGRHAIEHRPDLFTSETQPTCRDLTAHYEHFRRYNRQAYKYG